MEMPNKILLIPILFLIAISVFNTLIIFEKMGIITTFATSGSGQVSLIIMPREEGVRKPFLVNATRNIDNVTINISWSNISEASSYVVYYSGNLSALREFNLSSQGSQISNSSGITINRWTDSNAGNARMRYYKVSSVRGSNENLSNEIVGKFDIEIKTATLVPGEVEINTISLPLIPQNCKVSDMLPTPIGMDIISYYNTSRNPPAYDSAYYFMDMWNGDFDCFEPGKGYVFGPIIQGYNFTLTGDVPENNITIDIKNATLVPGEVEINTIGWNSPLVKCNLAELLPTPAGMDILSYYNTSRNPPAYDSAYYFMDMWNGDFACLEPGKGYIFAPITQDYSWTYNRT